MGSVSAKDNVLDTQKMTLTFHRLPAGMQKGFRIHCFSTQAVLL